MKMCPYNKKDLKLKKKKRNQNINLFYRNFFFNLPLKQYFKKHLPWFETVS